MTGTATDTTEKINTVVNEPSRYKVVIYNDDVTPMELVIAILMKVFRHDETASVELTMKIHNDGSAVAGIFNFEVAEQKGMEATNIARNQGHPLVIKVEAE